MCKSRMDYLEPVLGKKGKGLDRPELEKVIEIIASALSDNDVRPRAYEILNLFPDLREIKNQAIRIRAEIQEEIGKCKARHSRLKPSIWRHGLDRVIGLLGATKEEKDG